MILAQRPTHISTDATVLLITKTFTVNYYDRRTGKNTASMVIIIIIIIKERDRDRDRDSETHTHTHRGNNSHKARKMKKQVDIVGGRVSL